MGSKTKKLGCDADWDDEACLYCEKANTPKCPARTKKNKSEQEIKEEVWKIIYEEIEAVTKRRFVRVQHGYRFSEVKTVNVVMPKIKKRISELLEKHEAILVYQP